MAIAKIYRYPVKGLSAEELTTVSLLKDRGMPLDRRYAIARNPDVFDSEHPIAKPKGQFFMLMRDESLALLKTSFDDVNNSLAIKQNEAEQINFSFDDEGDRQKLAQFLKQYLEAEATDPMVVAAEGHKFTDISVVSPQKMHAISLINLASVRDLSKTIGRQVDPLRFRANVYFDGFEPWSEFDWLDREITLGEARLRITMRTKRCPATQVNPETSQRDIDIPRELRNHFGHADLGVYAEVIKGGEISVDATISLV